MAFVYVSMVGIFHQEFRSLIPLAPTLKALSYVSLFFGTFPFNKDEKHICSKRGKVKEINQMP